MSEDDMRLIEAIVRKNEGVLRVFLTPFAMLSCVTLDLNGPARARQGEGKKDRKKRGRSAKGCRGSGEWMLHEDGAPTTEQKIKEHGDVTRATRVQKQGTVEIGVGNGAWIESLYGNVKLRRKSVECNERPLILRGNNPIWHRISH